MKKIEIVYKLILNLVINLFIFSKLKVFLYRCILGYKIDNHVNLGFLSLIISRTVHISTNCKIGRFVVIYDCDNVELLSNVRIFRNTIISGLNHLYVGSGSVIGAYCSITSRHTDRNLFNIDKTKGGNLFIGTNSVLGRNHTLDLLGNIRIGNNVVVGGCYSQLFTHGYDCYRQISFGHITISNNVYIGTGVIILAGCSIAEEIVIAAGSVVCKSCKEKGVYGGNPIKLISNNPESKSFFVTK